MIKNEGFTLIEVMLTLMILAVGLLGMGAMTVTIIQENAMSNDLTIATTLAQDKIEEMKRIDYAIAADDEAYGDIIGYPEFKRVTQVAAATPNSRTSTVTVTVYWDSDNHSVEMKTIIAE